MLLKLFFAEHGPPGAAFARLNGYRERVAVRLEAYRALSGTR